MNVHLTSQLEQMVQAKVKSGRYNSASEVVREALRMMEERDAVKLEIKRKILAGVVSAQAGRLLDGDVFFDEMEAELELEIQAEARRQNS